MGLYEGVLHGCSSLFTLLPYQNISPTKEGLSVSIRFETTEDDFEQASLGREGSLSVMGDRRTCDALLPTLSKHCSGKQHRLLKTAMAASAAPHPTSRNPTSIPYTTITGCLREPQGPAQARAKGGELDDCEAPSQIGV